MSRQKKTRRVNSNGPKMGERVKVNQEEARLLKKQQKRKGLKAGSRNTETKEPTQQGNQAKVARDPRAGSKKPVALTVEQQVIEQQQLAAAAPVMLAQHQPRAKLVKTKPQVVAPVEKKISPEQELADLEANVRLSDLLDKLDTGETLNAKDSRWVSLQMARHHELLKQLDLLDEDEESPDDEQMLATFSSFDETWLQDIKKD